ncbi:MAG: hypothetical protein J1E31_08055 [Helicobacter sp.]|nr:hypothetical protein [Helicobacter sp.]
MQTRFLIIVFTFFTACILFVLVRFYMEATNSYSLAEMTPYDFNARDNNATEEIVPSWIERFSKNNDIQYFYPATELQVKFLFADNLSRPVKQIFRVSVGIINDYQFFCINQILNAHNIEYSYYKVGENIWLVVATEDENYLRNVLDKLKHYEINYTLSQS